MISAIFKEIGGGCPPRNLNRQGLALVNKRSLQAENSKNGMEYAHVASLPYPFARGCGMSAEKSLGRPRSCKYDDFT